MQILNNIEKNDRLEKFIYRISIFLDLYYPRISKSIILEINKKLINTQFKDLRNKDTEDVTGIERLVTIKDKNYYVCTVDFKRCKLENVDYEFIIAHEIAHAILDSLVAEYKDKSIKNYTCENNKIETGYILMCEHYANKKAFNILGNLGYSVDTGEIVKVGAIKVRKLVNKEIRIRSKKVADKFMVDIERHMAYIATSYKNKVSTTDNNVANYINAMYIKLEKVSNLVENGLATKYELDTELESIGKIHNKLVRILRHRKGITGNKIYRQIITKLSTLFKRHT